MEEEYAAGNDDARAARYGERDCGKILAEVNEIAAILSRARIDASLYWVGYSLAVRLRALP